jgi:hypothetical protein
MLPLNPGICKKPPTGCHLDKEIWLSGLPFLTSPSPGRVIEFGAEGWKVADGDYNGHLQSFFLLQRYIESAKL